MSDINLDFTVDSSNVNVTVEPNDVTFTPNAINLTVTSGALAVPGGNVGSLQYNANGVLGGIPTVTYVGGNLSLGDVSNVKLTGGTNGYVLQTDGTGNLSWTAQTGGGGGNGVPGGSNTQIQYNDSGSFGGNAGFTFNEVTGDVNIPGNLAVVGIIAGTVANANYANTAGSTANANYANTAGFATTSGTASVAGTVTTNAQPNITSVGTLTSLSISGNLSAGNANLGNAVSANFFIGSGNNLSNIQGANITGTVANATFATTAGTAGNATSANTAITVTASSQPNITSVGTLTTLETSSNVVTLGNAASAVGNSIAIGADALANRGGSSYDGIAVGFGSYAPNGAIAIGFGAGKFVSNAAANARHGIAIGPYTGYGNARGANTIAIGVNTGSNSKADSVVIGRSAGQAIGENSVVIGREAATSANVANVIVLNASGSAFNPAANSAFYVRPIRNVDGNTILQYSNSTGEITHSDNITANIVTIQNAGAIVPVSTGNGSIGYSGQRWGNIFANTANILTVISNAITSNNITFNTTISGNITPNAASSTTVTHKIPIVLNGVTYYMCLTNTP